MSVTLHRMGAAALTAIILCAAPPALAVAAKGPSADTKRSDAAQVEDIQAAISEQRYVDAGRLIDHALLSGVKNPMLIIHSGELNLVRGRHELALGVFRQASRYPEVEARAQQGIGLTLSLLGRSDEALGMLERAVATDAGAWRAWNAIGGEYDRRRDWSKAEAAYAMAVIGSGGTAIVLNNRGFSRLLQGRLDDAVNDLVAALEKQPGLSAARTNLRLAMGLKGDYSRALASGPQEDRAALLNNVGYAALLRGDQAQAQLFFNQAMAAKGQYYSRAANNLETATGLEARPSVPGNGIDVRD